MSKFKSAINDLFTIPDVPEHEERNMSTMFTKSTMLTKTQPKSKGAGATSSVDSRRRTFYINEKLYKQAEILMQIRGVKISEFINSVLENEISANQADIDTYNKFFQNKQ